MLRKIRNIFFKTALLKLKCYEIIKFLKKFSVQKIFCEKKIFEKVLSFTNFLKKNKKNKNKIKKNVFGKLKAKSF